MRMALFLRDDGQQHMRLTAGAGVQRDVASEHGRRPVTRIVMRERPDAGPDLAERLHACARFAWIDVVGATDGQREAIAFRQDNAGRPDLDIDLVDLAGGELLLLVMRMVGPVWQRQLWIELAVRAAQPPLSDRGVGVQRSLERDLLEVRRECAHHQEQVGIFGRRRYPEPGGDRAGDLGFLLERFRQEGYAFAHSGIGHSSRRRLRAGRERHVSGMEIEFGPLRARERPFILMPLDELLARMADLEQDLRLLVPARILAFEEMTEEFLLQADAVVRIKMRPVLDTVDLEPFLFGGRAHEALEISARVQTLSAPVRRGQQRSLHSRPVRHAGLPEGVGVELARDAVLVEIAAIAAELLLRKRLRPGDPVAVHAAPEAARVASVLDGIDLGLRPVLHEAAVENSAMMRHVAVEIGRALPGADRGQVLWLQRRRLPLVLRVIGNAVEADLAVRPGLRPGPFDAAGEVLRLPQGPDVDHAGRTAGAAAVDPDADITVG